jgi:hypothetical protein
MMSYLPPVKIREREKKKDKQIFKKSIKLTIYFIWYFVKKKVYMQLSTERFIWKYIYIFKDILI